MKNLIFIKSAFIIIVLSLLISACKKDKIAPIEGEWSGTYFINGPNSTSNINFSFTANNTLTVDNEGTNVTSNGTWSLAGNNFEAKWMEMNSGNTVYYTFRAIVDMNAIKFTNGTWSQNIDQNGEFVSLGTWSMTKQ